MQRVVVPRTRLYAGLCAWLALSFGGLPARPARAFEDDPDIEVARRHFAAGGEFYSQGRYQEAMTEFEAARRAKPSPAYDFNIGRCYDRMERWREAAAAYRAYLAGAPDATDGPSVRERIADLDRRVAAMAPRIGIHVSDHAARRKRIAAGIVGAAGLALGAVGIAFAVLHDQAASDLTALDMNMYTFEPARERDLKTDGVLAPVFLSIGGAALVTSVVVFALARRDARRARASSLAVASPLPWMAQAPAP
jgi:tetratricopeptide (TPR) repeat protein